MLGWGQADGLGPVSSYKAHLGALITGELQDPIRQSNWRLILSSLKLRCLGVGSLHSGGYAGGWGPARAPQPWRAPGTQGQLTGHTVHATAAQVKEGRRLEVCMYQEESRCQEWAFGDP